MVPDYWCIIEGRIQNIVKLVERTDLELLLPIICKQVNNVNNGQVRKLCTFC